MFSCWFWTFWWWGLSTATGGLKVRVVNTTGLSKWEAYESMNKEKCNCKKQQMGGL